MFVTCPVCATGVAEVQPWVFAETRATVVTCGACRDAGIVAIEVPVSAVAAMDEVAPAGPVRFAGAMVAFA